MNVISEQKLGRKYWGMITSFGFFAILALFKWGWSTFPLELAEASGFIVKVYGIFVGGNALSKIPRMFKGESHGGPMETD